MGYPSIAFGTPRRLPKPSKLKGRVAVLDIAFAAGAGGASFEKVTKPFIVGLGNRLAAWIDHHDHVAHRDFAHDPRFVLRTKAEHGACPEMITPERVARAGAVDTICCHTDFDGLCSAAKWIREGVEPYPGADADARAIDTRIGKPGEMGEMIDRALRARFRDDALRASVVEFLASGAKDADTLETLRSAAEQLKPLEAEARRLANNYELQADVAIVDVRKVSGHYDKTLLLLLGQERAAISIVHDARTVTIATRFDSGIDLLSLLGLQGGMPTVVSVTANELESVVHRLVTRSRATEASAPSA